MKRYIRHKLNEWKESSLREPLLLMGARQVGKTELDFVLQIEDQILPLEVKSGKSFKHQSLRVYMNHYKPPFALRCSPLNLVKEVIF